MEFNIQFQPMRKLLLPLILLSLFCNAFSQSCTYQVLNFTYPALQSGTALSVGAVYKYSNVLSGVNCYVKILATNNGSLTNIDDTTAAYKVAFQPVSVTTSTAANPGWVKFLFDFRYASDSSSYSNNCLALGVIDNDGAGAGTYSERISTEITLHTLPHREHKFHSALIPSSM